MKTKTIRTMYVIGLILAVLLFAAMVWDHYQNDNDLLTPLLIAFIVVAALLILMLFLRGDPAAQQTLPGETVTDPDNLDYPGDVHEVVDLEGIGPTYAEKLGAMGIQNTQQLLFADTAELARQTGAAKRTVENWKSMSQLVKIGGIGPQYAEALVRAGIDSIEELRDEPAAAIAGAVKGYLDSLETNVIGNTITTKRVENWQKKAKKMHKEPIDPDTCRVMPLGSKAAQGA